MLRLIITLLLIYSIGGAQEMLNDKIYLIELETQGDIPYEHYLTSIYDYKKYETDVTMFPLDYEMGITPIEDFTECFQPDIKIITANHTYLICTATAEGLLYVNKAPYQVQECATPIKIKLDENAQEFIAELEEYLIDYNKVLSYHCNVYPFDDNLMLVMEGELIEYEDNFFFRNYIYPDIETILYEDDLDIVILEDNIGLTTEFNN